MVPIGRVLRWIPFLLPLFLTLLVARNAFPQEPGVSPSRPSPASYAGFLTSKADPVTRPVFTAYFLGIPAAVVGQAAVPVYRGSGVVLTGGELFWPGSGFLVSSLVRLQLLTPTESRPGVVLLGASVFGIAWSEVWGGGANIQAAELVVSSPVRRFRLHAGAALHTMPGSEGGRPYDWDNPQAAATLLAELQATRRTLVFMEGLWAGIGAHGGFDSIATLLAGIEWSWTRTHLKLATGIFTDRAGAQTQMGRLFPLPPMAALVYSF